MIFPLPLGAAGLLCTGSCPASGLPEVSVRFTKLSEIFTFLCKVRQRGRRGGIGSGEARGRLRGRQSDIVEKAGCWRTTHISFMKVLLSSSGCRQWYCADTSTSTASIVGTLSPATGYTIQGYLGGVLIPLGKFPAPWGDCRTASHQRCITA